MALAPEGRILPGHARDAALCRILATAAWEQTLHVQHGRRV